MAYLKNFKNLDNLNNKKLSRPGVITLNNSDEVYYVPIDGYGKNLEVTLEKLNEKEILIGYLKTIITCSQDTTLPVYYTKESWLSETPDEILKLIQGDNIFYFDKSIYRIEILNYSRTTGKRVSGNIYITGITLDGSIEDGYRLFDQYESFINIQNINLTKLNTSKIKSLFCCFQSNLNLTKLDLSGWNVSNVTSMRSMFWNCNSLTSIGDLSGWNVSNVTSMRSMFWNCFELTSLGDLSGWSAPLCTDAGYMFGGYEGTMKLTSLDLTILFKNGVVKDLIAMFQNCSNLTQVGDLSEWDVSNVTDFSYMFYNCNSLTSIGDLSGWDISNVTDMTQMFCRCENLTSLGDLSGWNVSKTDSINYMFSICISLTYIGNISRWNVNKVTNFESTFQGTNCCNGIDFSLWDTSNATNMSYMFNAFYGISGKYKPTESIGIPTIPKNCNTYFMFNYQKSLTTIMGCGKISSSISFEDSPLTKESVMLIIQNLDQDNPGTLTLSNTSYNYLSENDLELATNKGWTIAKLS